MRNCSDSLSSSLWWKVGRKDSLDGPPSLGEGPARSLLRLVLGIPKRASWLLSFSILLFPVSRSATPLMVRKLLSDGL